MSGNIISRVSEIILETRSGKRVSIKDSNVQVLGNKGDRVSISQKGSEANLVSKELDKEEMDRANKVEMIKKQVNNNNYPISEKIIEDVAEKIAGIFI